MTEKLKMVEDIVNEIASLEYKIQAATEYVKSYQKNVVCWKKKDTEIQERV